MVVSNQGMDSNHYKYSVYFACLIGEVSKQTLQEVKQIKKIEKDSLTLIKVTIKVIHMK